MSHFDVKSAKRADPDKVLVDIAYYATDFEIKSDLAYETARYCLMDTLACGFLALNYPACTKLLGPGRARRHLAGRRARAGHDLRARSGAGRVQHRRDDPLARLQRHLARGRVGPSVRQSRRASSPSRTTCRARPCAEGRKPLTVRDVLTGDDQGARDPGRARAGKQLQPRRPRSRAPGAHRLDRGRHAACSAARKEQIINAVSQCLDRRRRAAHLSPRAEHRLAQELGRGRRDAAAPCAMR